jgi:NAD(P)-dependent dehydrogenase (short-subunit alcohol dehydrogenase family)
MLCQGRVRLAVRWTLMTERKVVLTTGTTSGIGLATAIELAKRGFESVATYRSEHKLPALQQAAHDAGVTVHAVRLDVTDADGCARVVAEVLDRHGALHGLVNNAGYGLRGAVEDTSDDEARQIFETMVLAPARLSRLVLPHLRAAGGGRIVNISSIYGRTTTPLSGWYQAAKHALEGLSDALRAEVGGDGVHVILVEPGGFRTEIWEEQVVRNPSERYRTAYERTQKGLQMAAPLLGDPAACAKVVAGALQARMPRARYLVGPDAYLAAAVLPLTPPAVKDRIARAFLGL